MLCLEPTIMTESDIGRGLIGRLDATTLALAAVLVGGDACTKQNRGEEKHICLSSFAR